MNLTKKIILTLLSLITASHLLISKGNFVGKYEVNVYPNILTIEFKSDYTFEIVDSAKYYDKRSATGKWELKRGDTIIINTFNQLLPFEETQGDSSNIVTIKVVDTKGNPIEQARVMVDLANNQGASSMTDKNGLIKFKYSSLIFRNLTVYGPKLGIFGNKYHPNKIFKNHVTITFMDTDSQPIVNNGKYLIMGDTLIELGEPFSETYGYAGTLVFSKVYNIEKLKNIIIDENKYFKYQANSDFFKKDTYDSTKYNYFTIITTLIGNIVKNLDGIGGYNKNEYNIFERQIIGFNDAIQKIKAEDFFHKKFSVSIAKRFEKTISKTGSNLIEFESITGKFLELKKKQSIKR
ncbi:MAG: hypothetical protein HW421_2667 [Ignavibacteria bacterium]|nr:hypothetical protein [Ignavibacteria bacterium]